MAAIRDGKGKSEAPIKSSLMSGVNISLPLMMVGEMVVVVEGNAGLDLLMPIGKPDEIRSIK